MDSSPNLALPYIVAAQAQKHVTHNEAIRSLDAVVQLMVLDKDLATPPGSPADGDRYIVAASPTGAWSGQAGKIAAWQDGAWTFYGAREGWLAWAADEDKAYVYTGSAWSVFLVAALGYTSANKAGDDFTGALSVALDGTLSGGTQQLTIKGVSNPAKQLWTGFDMGGDYGFISAAIAGSSFQPLALNRDGSNVGIGTATFGASANKAVSQNAGTAPTTAPADHAQLWVEDIGGTAGKAGFHMMAESGTAKLAIAGVILKTTTGDPSQVHEGLLAINTFDNTAKIYADGGWRTIASGW